MLREKRIVKINNERGGTRQAWNARFYSEQL